MIKDYLLSMKSFSEGLLDKVADLIPDAVLSGRGYGL